jgi:hypothetical protein
MIYGLQRTKGCISAMVPGGAGVRRPDVGSENAGRKLRRVETIP